MKWACWINQASSQATKCFRLVLYGEESLEIKNNNDNKFIFSLEQSTCYMNSVYIWFPFRTLNVHHFFVVWYSVKVRFMRAVHHGHSTGTVPSVYSTCHRKPPRFAELFGNIQQRNWTKWSKHFSGLFM